MKANNIDEARNEITEADNMSDNMLIDYCSSDMENFQEFINEDCCKDIDISKLLGLLAEVVQMHLDQKNK